MAGISADTLRVLLDADDVMGTLASVLNYDLHLGTRAAQKLKHSPNDHIGLFKDGTLDDVSYKDLLFRVNDPSCGTEERKVYEKYMGYAEIDYLKRGYWWFRGLEGLEFLGVDMYADSQLLRRELTVYFSLSKKKSGRNEEAHRFSNALKSVPVFKSSGNGLSQYVLQDTPSYVATQNPALRAEILDRLEKLLDFDELPESVKQPLLSCKNVFQLQVRYLKRIFSDGALRRTDQGTYHRVSANSTRW